MEKDIQKRPTCSKKNVQKRPIYVKSMFIVGYADVSKVTWSFENRLTKETYILEKRPTKEKKMYEKIVCRGVCGWIKRDLYI